MPGWGGYLTENKGGSAGTQTGAPGGKREGCTTAGGVHWSAAMSYTLQFETDGAVAHFTGQLTAAGLRAARQEIYDRKYEGPLRWAMFDLTEATGISLSTADLREIALGAEKYLETHPKYSLVLLTSRALEFGLSRMYEAFVDRVGLPTFVTSSREQALKWLQAQANQRSDFQGV